MCNCKCCQSQCTSTYDKPVWGASKNWCGCPCANCVAAFAKAAYVQGQLAAKPTHWNTAKTHCPKGHPYNAENTVISGGKRPGWRQCKQCRKEADRRRYLERKALDGPA